MNRTLRFSLPFILLLLPAFQLSAKAYPIPENVKNVLFYIQRSIDSNVVVYQLNKDQNGKLNEAEPIKVFWIKHNQGGVQEELTSIQKSMSYGVVILSHNAKDGSFIFRFAGYKKRVFSLNKSLDDKQYHVYGFIGATFGEMESIYINITGGSFWIPTIEHVDILGENVQNKSVIKEQIKP